ncbi:MAG: radical SAM protein [Bacteroidales bacterium]|nr:radical SAM protein [Bacteroidales bacterium]
MEHNDKAQLTLFLTNSCNLNCVYCYEQKDSFVMSFECATGWITKCLNNSDQDFWYICLFGGEPLLQYPLVKRLCEWTWQQEWSVNYKFLIQTNGTLLNDEMKNWFSINKDKIGMCLSLDGKKETHDKNRNNSFDRIDIDFFLSNWPDMPVKMTISRHQISSIKDDIVWLQEKGFDIRGSNFAVGEGEYTEKEYDIIEDQLKQLSDYYISNPKINIAPILDVPLHLLSLPYDSLNRICNLGTDKLIVVNTDGTTSPCSYFSNISSRKNDINLQKQLKEFGIKKTICFDTCEFAPICNVCYAENYTETGNMYKPSKQRCRIMKMRIFAAMYMMANRIANKKDITYEDTLTIKSIKSYYQQLKNALL